MNMNIIKKFFGAYGKNQSKIISVVTDLWKFK